ncbi:MAG: metallophosphoesterase [Burkholderiales bacterium]|nr:metallophosphoesterase [Burkholderiales bacterium]
MISIRNGAAGLLALVAVLAGCAVQRPEPAEVATSAWVQASDEGAWVVRAIGVGAACPTLHSKRGDTAMSRRAAPVELPPRTEHAQPQTQPSRFADAACEAAWPAGASRVHVGDHVLTAPAAAIRRIVLIGDTGCRMKASEHSYQDCRDAARWPLAQVAASAAAWHPDLVVHVGDYEYRESPCPAGNAGCAGSPWGYGEDAWRADFFDPAAPLLAVAPWIFVRGNHESCSRAGAGWFRYLDAHPWRAASSCADPALDEAADFSAPYAVPIDAQLQLIVFDSSRAGGKAYRGDEFAARRYAEDLAAVDALVQRRPQNWFVNHHPVLAYAGSEDGRPLTGGKGLRSVMVRSHPQRYYADGIDLVLNGHVHLFEAIDFSSPHPAELVLGNSGSLSEGGVEAAAALASQPAPGATVRTFVTRNQFGYATLEREGAGWLLTERDPRGMALRRCRLLGSRLECAGLR